MIGQAKTGSDRFSSGVYDQCGRARVRGNP
ncbi:hypothetical protein FHS90_001952 [Rufibacter quisquiliarum]|uniref:Uncharacterized protein n=1 Tax=Rufibacter quisquiliarum TaxID=1549639 RepID=A0A839GTX8_9BACT|nr:hypothetical protein [Rufibacter quisquiliarum]